MTKKTQNNHTLLLVFIAFILGFTMPVCSCMGISAVTTWQLSKFAETSIPELGLGTGDAVAVINLSGTITSSSQIYAGMQGITPTSMANLLGQATANDDIKAIVLRVNSPGGSVVASDEIYHALLDFEKPIVISMGETAASGGYYIACGGDYIIAHPDTLTGSIGVISQFFVFEELMEKYGVEAEIITSGANKALGNPYKKMSEEEREIMENIIN
ncbi:MAG: signal peptide peptidase SppA, partial [Chloroflexota bacterium]|nr:signal peptide peptidase SppA [Chloroflexota bacterium]